jgi:multidrug efflux system membrane fusion protein
MRLRSLIPLTGALALAGAAWLVVVERPDLLAMARASLGLPSDQARDSRTDRGDGRVMVSAVPVERRDVPVRREGIGTVVANALVTVRAQVEGRLIEIAFREGEEVKAGDVLARIDPSAAQAALDQALARLAQSQANLANARLDLDRYERLAAANAGPRQQADQQRAQVAQLAAQVRAEEAAAESARITLAHTTIRAPIDGRAGLRQIDVGNVVRASDVNGLVTLAQVRPVSVLFTLPQRDLGLSQQALAAGAPLTEALDTDGRSVVARGTLAVIDNQVDPATGTIRLKAVFPNADLRLWPGQFVTIRLEVGTLKAVPVVPTPAVRRGPGGAFVYVVANGTAQVRKVTVTRQDEAVAVIEDGLGEGDSVITAGFPQLSDGKAVAIAPEPGIRGREPPPSAAAQGVDRRGS